MEIDFIQGETPVGYYIKDTYKYQTNLSLKVQGGEVGSTTDCQVKIENPTGSTVNVTISGFNNAGGSMSNFENSLLPESMLLKQTMVVTRSVWVPLKQIPKNYR